MSFLISLTRWIIIDPIGTWRTWLAILLPPSFMRRCDKPHPSKLTASFKVMGKSDPICLSALRLSDKPVHSADIGGNLKWDMEASVNCVLFLSIVETSTGYQQSYNTTQAFPVYIGRIWKVFCLVVIFIFVSSVCTFYACANVICIHHPESHSNDFWYTGIFPT